MLLGLVAPLSYSPRLLPQPGHGAPAVSRRFLTPYELGEELGELVDNNGDGVINRKEFKVLFPYLIDSAGVALGAGIKATFAEWDLDSDGLLTLDELAGRIQAEEEDGRVYWYTHT